MPAPPPAAARAVLAAPSPEGARPPQRLMTVAGPSTADRSVADRSAGGDGLTSSRADNSSAPDERATVPVARPVASLSFPREARLLDKRAYDAVFGDNRRLADRYWTVLVHTPGEASGHGGGEPAPDWALPSRRNVPAARSIATASSAWRASPFAMCAARSANVRW